MSLFNRLKLHVLAAATIVLFFTQNALAGAPRFSTINYPGATATFALGINPAGDIVGAWDDVDGNEHGFLLRNGMFTSLDYPGSSWTDAYGINPQGDIVGQYGGADNATHGFLLRQGNFYPVEIPGPTDLGLANSMPYKISPSGTIVGCYHQGRPNGSIIAGTMHGFALSAAGVAFNSTPGTMNLGVNPDGAITGYNSSSPQSYVIVDGVQTWFTYPGAAVTRATDISAPGIAIGWYRDASGHIHGFTKHTDALSRLDMDGAANTWPYGINAVGDIVGYYTDETGYHGFLLSRRDP